MKCTWCDNEQAEDSNGLECPECQEHFDKLFGTGKYKKKETEK